MTTEEFSTKGSPGHNDDRYTVSVIGINKESGDTVLYSSNSVWTAKKFYRSLVAAMLTTDDNGTWFYGVRCHDHIIQLDICYRGV